MQTTNYISISYYMPHQGTPREVFLTRYIVTVAVMKCRVSEKKESSSERNESRYRYEENPFQCEIEPFDKNDDRMHR